MTIEINPLSGGLGAEIHGLDLSQTLDAETFASIRHSFDNDHVLVFRDQQLTPRQHEEFASRFFELKPHPYVQSIEGHPGIIEIVKERDEIQQWGGTGFHADLTFLERPPAGAALYAREVPDVGGDTMFVNMQLVYEALSPGMKEMLSKVNTIHESLPPAEYSAGFKGMYKKHGAAGSTSHPMVIAHPVTGQKSLYLNPTLTRRFENMTDAESRPLLDYLIRHALRPEFSCRVRWTAGSLVVWNNQAVLHCALNDDFEAVQGREGFRRVLHRATFEGVRPLQ
jgi:taurine dioxygenase